MSAPARKQHIRQANEAIILEAAERVFAENGYTGASIARIARESGLPKANVHYYFNTKQDLYRQVLRRVLGDWMHAADAFETDRDPKHALETYVRAKMEYSRKRPMGSRVWASEIIGGAPVLEDVLGTTLKEWVAQSVRYIRRWIRNGEIEDIDPHALLYMIWATTQHYADFERQVEILNGKPLSDRQYRERTDEVVNLILRSVGL